MRFIVDLYRYIIFVTLALMLIAGTVGLLEVTKLGVWNPLAIMTYAYAFFAFVMVILVIGFVAIAVSIHDRHAELVDEVRLLRLNMRSTSEPIQ